MKELFWVRCFNLYLCCPHKIAGVVYELSECIKYATFVCNSLYLSIHSHMGSGIHWDHHMKVAVLVIDS